MTTSVAIIGAGNIGQAIGHVLSGVSGVEIALWDTDERKVSEQISLQETVDGADVVFLCVNSWAVRSAAESFAEFLSKDTLVISPTKGLEQQTLYTPDHVLRDVLPVEQQIAIMNGPMLSKEIMDDLPAFAVIATQHRRSYDRIDALFAGTTIHLEHSTDVHGAALAGVLKNVYSIGLGMTEAMKLGSDFRGWFVKQSCAEMAGIIEQLGGVRATAYTAAGLADLVATGFSPQSRNCRAGQELVTSGECITVSEGAASLPQMHTLLGDTVNRYPVMEMISRILLDTKNAHDEFAALLERV